MVKWAKKESDIYPLIFIVVVSSDPFQIKKFLDRSAGGDIDWGDKSPYGTTITSRVKKHGEWHNCIYVVLSDDASLDHGVIAHEALHVVHFLFENIGLTMSEDSIEAWTYMLQFVVDFINGSISKFSKKYAKSLIDDSNRT